MSSDFENALARAAAQRNERDETEAREKREYASNLTLAHSIVDPYLASLGPQVVRTLRSLKIQPIGLDQYGGKQRLSGCWLFEYYYHHDLGSNRFSLGESGRFGNHFDNTEPVKLGLVRSGEVFWRSLNVAPLFLANMDDKKVYIHQKYPEAEVERVQELSDFIAEYIYLKMKN